MNDALELAFKEAKAGGYKGNIESFKTLLETNEKAFSLAHGNAISGGYGGNKTDFSEVLGIRSKGVVTKSDVEYGKKKAEQYSSMGKLTPSAENVVVEDVKIPPRNGELVSEDISLDLSEDVKNNLNKALYDEWSKTDEQKLFESTPLKSPTSTKNLQQKLQSDKDRSEKEKAEQQQERDRINLEKDKIKQTNYEDYITKENWYSLDEYDDGTNYEQIIKELGLEDKLAKIEELKYGEKRLDRQIFQELFGSDLRPNIMTSIANYFGAGLEEEKFSGAVGEVFGSEKPYSHSDIVNQLIKSELSKPEYVELRQEVSEKEARALNEDLFNKIKYTLPEGEDVDKVIENDLIENTAKKDVLTEYPEFSFDVAQSYINKVNQAKDKNEFNKAQSEYIKYLDSIGLDFDKNVFGTDTSDGAMLVDFDGNFVRRKDVPKENQEDLLTLTEYTQYQQESGNIPTDTEELRNSLINKSFQILREAKEIISNEDYIANQQGFFRQLGETSGDEEYTPSGAIKPNEFKQIREMVEAGKMLPGLDNIEGLDDIESVAKYNSLLNEYKVLSQALLMNYDPTTLDKESFGTGFRSGAAQAFAGIDVLTDDEKGNIMLDELEYNFPEVYDQIPEKERKDIRESTWMYGAGEMLPPFIKIAGEFALTRKIAGGSLGQLNRALTGGTKYWRNRRAIGQVGDAVANRYLYGTGAFGRYVPAITNEMLVIEGRNLIANTYGDERMSPLWAVGGVGAGKLFDDIGSKVLSSNNKTFWNAYNGLTKSSSKMKIPTRTIGEGFKQNVFRPVVGATTMKIGTIGELGIEVATGEIKAEEFWNQVLVVDENGQSHFWKDFTQTAGTIWAMRFNAPLGVFRRGVDNIKYDISKIKKQTKGHYNKQTQILGTSKEQLSENEFSDKISDAKLDEAVNKTVEEKGLYGEADLNFVSNALKTLGLKANKLPKNFDEAFFDGYFNDTFGGKKVLNTEKGKQASDAYNFLKQSLFKDGVADVKKLQESIEVYNAKDFIKFDNEMTNVQQAFKNSEDFGYEDVMWKVNRLQTRMEKGMQLDNIDVEVLGGSGYSKEFIKLLGIEKGMSERDASIFAEMKTKEARSIIDAANGNDLGKHVNSKNQVEANKDRKVYIDALIERNQIQDDLISINESIKEGKVDEATVSKIKNNLETKYEKLGGKVEKIAEVQTAKVKALYDFDVAFTKKEAEKLGVKVEILKTKSEVAEKFNKGPLGKIIKEIESIDNKVEELNKKGFKTDSPRARKVKGLIEQKNILIKEVNTLSEQGENLNKVMSDGWFDPKADDGKGVIYINEKKALEKRKGRNWRRTGVGSHELLHVMLRKAFKDSDGKINESGIKLIDAFKNTLEPNQLKFIEDQISRNYVADGFTKEQYYEEYLTTFVDHVKSGNIKINDKIEEVLNKESSKFDVYDKTGEGLKNFLYSFVKSSEQGKLRQEISDLVGEEVVQHNEEVKNEVKEKEKVKEETVVEEAGFKPQTAEEFEKVGDIPEVLKYETTDSSTNFDGRIKEAEQQQAAAKKYIEDNDLSLDLLKVHNDNVNNLRKSKKDIEEKIEKQKEAIKVKGTSAKRKAKKDAAKEVADEPVTVESFIAGEVVNKDGDVSSKKAKDALREGIKDGEGNEFKIIKSGKKFIATRNKTTIGPKFNTQQAALEWLDGDYWKSNIFTAKKSKIEKPKLASITKLNKDFKTKEDKKRELQRVIDQGMAYITQFASDVDKNSNAQSIDDVMTTIQRAKKNIRALNTEGKIKFSKSSSLDINKIYDENKENWYLKDSKNVTGADNAVADIIGGKKLDGLIANTIDKVMAKKSGMVLDPGVKELIKVDAATQLITHIRNFNREFSAMNEKASYDQTTSDFDNVILHRIFNKTKKNPNRYKSAEDLEKSKTNWITAILNKNQVSFEEAVNKEIKSLTPAEKDLFDKIKNLKLEISTSKYKTLKISFSRLGLQELEGKIPQETFDKLYDYEVIENESLSAWINNVIKNKVFRGFKNQTGEFEFNQDVTEARNIVSSDNIREDLNNDFTFEEEYKFIAEREKFNTESLRKKLDVTNEVRDNIREDVLTDVIKKIRGDELRGEGVLTKKASEVLQKIDQVNKNNAFSDSQRRELINNLEQQFDNEVSSFKDSIKKEFEARYMDYVRVNLFGSYLGKERADGIIPVKKNEKKYIDFLKRNFAVIYDKIPIDVLTTKYAPDFNRPEFDFIERGERMGMGESKQQLIRDAKAGNIKWRKLEIDELYDIVDGERVLKQEIIDYFVNPKKSNPNERMTSLARTIATELAFDATMEAFRSEKFQDVLMERKESLLGNELEVAAKALKRDPNLLFSRSDLGGTLSSKRDLKWEEDAAGYMTEFDLETKKGKKVTFMMELDRVGNNELLRTLRSSKVSKSFIDDLKKDNGKILYSAFGIKNEQGFISDYEMTGDGIPFRTLGVVGNGMVDFIKNNNVKSIIFDAKEESRKKSYNFLSKLLASELGWETKSFDRVSRSDKDIVEREFVVYKPKQPKEVDSNFSLSTSKDLKWELHKHMMGLESETSKFEIKGKDYEIKMSSDPDIAKRFDNMYPNATEGKVQDISFALLQKEDGRVVRRTDITGTGDAGRVMSVVVNGIKDFAENNKVKGLTFTAQEASRASLYKAIAEKVNEDLGWDLVIEPYGFDGGNQFVLINNKTSEAIKEIESISTKQYKIKRSKDIEDVIIPEANFENFIQSQNIRFSKSDRQAYEKTLEKARPDLKGRISEQVDSIFKFIDKSDIPQNKQKKFEQLALHYMKNGYLILPEDGYKLIEAEKIAKIKKVDPLSFKNPNEVMALMPDRLAKNSFNPDKTESFTNRKVLSEGVVVYDVASTEQGQKDVRLAIDRDFGNKANPWCLCASDENGITKASKDNWKNYNTSGHGYKIAFQNGKLIAFRDGEAKEWWNRMDEPSDNIPISRKLKDGWKETGHLENGKFVVDKLEKGQWNKSGKYIVKKPDGTILTNMTNKNDKAFNGFTTYIIDGESTTKTTFKDGIRIKREEDETGMYAHFLGRQLVMFDSRKPGTVFSHFRNINKITKWNQTTERVSPLDSTVDLHFSLRTETLEVEGVDQVLGDFKYKIVKINDNKQNTSSVEKLKKELEVLSNGEATLEGDIPGTNFTKTLYEEINGRKFITPRTVFVNKEMKDYSDYELSSPLELAFSVAGYRRGAKKLETYEPGAESYLLKKVDLDYKETGRNDKVIARNERINDYDKLSRKSDGYWYRANKKIYFKEGEFDNLGEFIKFSKSNNLQGSFNSIIDNVAKEVNYGQDLDKTRAETIGRKNRKKLQFFIPYSHEDFNGLMYPLLGKGKLGDAQFKWMEDKLLKPYAKAMNELSTTRLQVANDYKILKKQLKVVPKNLRKEAFAGVTNEQAIRMYIWDSQGMKIPETNEKTLEQTYDFMNENPEIQAFADQVMSIQKGDNYPKPEKGWQAGTITTDLMRGLNTVKRKKYLKQWKENRDLIFSKQNMYKLEALFGHKYVEALSDILRRMETGVNRKSQMGRNEERLLNFVNNSTGTVMFYNARSAVLQTISAANFMNWTDNNPLKVAQATFGSPLRFAKDFKEIFNSDFLKDRRGGNRINVSEEDIANAIKGGGNSAQRLMSLLLDHGFVLTKGADSFAIAFGGASFYRNRLKTYIKKGLSEAEAKERAFIDFREKAEESQQSSRADKISQQQASSLGRIVLAFGNTPAQYARLQKRAFQDLVKGRGDWKHNLSKIAYYGFVQNMIFTTLQNALMYTFWGEDDEAKLNKKYIKTANSMVDNILRGLGYGGAALATTKNMALKFWEESQKGYGDTGKAADEMLKYSPTISSKIGKVSSAENTRRWEDKSIWRDVKIASKYVSVFNVPTDRLVQKMDNINSAMEADRTAMQRVLLMTGWNDWNLGIEDDPENLFGIPGTEPLFEKEKKKSKKGGYKKPKYGGFKTYK